MPSARARLPLLVSWPRRETCRPISHETRRGNSGKPSSEQVEDSGTLSCGPVASYVCLQRFSFP